MAPGFFFPQQVAQSCFYFLADHLFIGSSCHYTNEYKRSGLLHNRSQCAQIEDK